MEERIRRFYEAWIEFLQVMKLYRKTIQQLSCTYALIIMCFLDSYMKDFQPNDLSYYCLTGLAGYTIYQSTRQQIKQKSNEDNEEL